MQRRTRPLFQRHARGCYLLFLLATTLLLDFAGTGIYHLFKYGTLQKFADRRALGERSPLFHHTLKPMAEYRYQRWGDFRHSVFTNSLGFRDRAVVELPLTSDRYRVLFLGDSFTYGVGLPYEKTFACLVEQGLADKRVEILNGAVVSYSPAIYWKKTEALLARAGLRFDHLVLFLDISDVHDEAVSYDIVEDRVVWIGGSTPALREFLFEYTTILRNLWEIAASIYRRAARDPDVQRTEEDRSLAANEYRSLWTVDARALEDYGTVGLRKARRHMDRLHDLLQDYRIGMTLVVYPWPTQILRKDLQSLQVTYWREWAAERSVGFLDLFPAFLQAGRDPKEVIRRYFLPGDLHWNEQGHRLVAETFLRMWTPPAGSTIAGPSTRRLPLEEPTASAAP
jgi:hypothetical protein